MNRTEHKHNADVAAMTVPVIEEQVEIANEVVETGKVSIIKKVFNEPYSSDVLLTQQQIIIERKPVGQYVDDTLPLPRQEGNTTIIPVLKEVMVKRLLLVEEIYITKSSIDSSISVNETLRREEVVIKRSSGEDLL